MSATTEASRDLYCGLDLHSRNTLAGIVDQEGRRRCHRRLNNTIAEIDAFLRPHKPRLKSVVVESTYNWYWLVDGLDELGYPMVLAHPAAMAPYAGLKHSGDKTDAYWLADQCRLGLIPKAYIYPKEDRPLRDLLRRRGLLVQNRTSLVLSLGSMHVRETGVPLGRGVSQSWDEEDMRAIFPAQFSLTAATGLHSLIEAFTTQIKEFEAQALRAHRPNELFQRVTRLDGVANILGMVISLETGSMNRFAEAHKDRQNAEHDLGPEWNTETGLCACGYALARAGDRESRDDPEVARDALRSTEPAQGAHSGGRKDDLEGWGSERLT